MPKHCYAIGYLFLFLGAVCAGCVRTPPVKVPMATWLYAEEGKGNGNLIIFLPGINDQPTKYEKRGFVDDLRRRELEFDVIAVDAHFGYYAERSVVDRLKADVITPAKARGYDKIWLVGFSIGGLGSLLYAMEHPGDIEGMLTLAPYLGGSDLISEIQEAGGPLSWQPDAIAEDDGLRKLWVWLKNYHKRNEEVPPLYLGYGDRDKFAVADSMLAGLLPPERVYVIPGWHNWGTWKKLWEKALDAGLFADGSKRARLRTGPFPAGRAKTTSTMHWAEKR